MRSCFYVGGILAQVASIVALWTGGERVEFLLYLAVGLLFHIAGNTWRED